jgi:hypothetical protein
MSRDVVFDETIYPFAKLNPNAGTRLWSEIILLPSSSKTLATSSPRVQILDSSTTDTHIFSVPANASGPAAALRENSASFDAGMFLELALQDSNGGCGLDINPEDDSLVQTFSSIGIGSHVGTAGVLPAAYSSPQADPYGLAWEFVHVPRFSATNAAASSSPLAIIEFPTTADPVGSDFKPAQFFSPVGSNPVPVVSSLGSSEASTMLPVPARQNTHL